MTGESRNEPLFDDAVARLRESECYWRDPLEYALGHPTDLVVDYDSLGGRFDLVQPFVHHAVAGALGAIAKVGFDPASREPLGAAVQRVAIAASSAGQDLGVTIEDGLLTVRWSLDDGGPDGGGEDAAQRTAKIEEAIRRALSRTDSREPAAPCESLPPTRGTADSCETVASCEPVAPRAPTPAHRETLAPREAAASRELPSASSDDPYERAAMEMLKLEAALRNAGIWPGKKPASEIEVQGAFGCENMSFAQWLGWVLIPRLRDIVDERGEFPEGSMLGPYAIRECNGLPGEAEVRDALYAIDELINGLQR